MAKEETKRSGSEEPENEQPVVNREYQRTWGSTRQAKLAFAAKAEEEAKDSDDEAPVSNPGVNPSISPVVKAPDNIK